MARILTYISIGLSGGVLLLFLANSLMGWFQASWGISLFFIGCGSFLLWLGMSLLKDKF